MPQGIEYCPTEEEKRETVTMSIEYHSEAGLAIEEVLSAQANIPYPHSNFMTMGLDHFNVHSQRN